MRKVSKEKIAEMTELDKQLADKLLEQKKTANKLTFEKLVPCVVFSQPSIYIDGWLYAMRMTSVVCNVPVLSQNDSTYHHSVFTA